MQTLPGTSGHLPPWFPQFKCINWPGKLSAILVEFRLTSEGSLVRTQLRPPAGPCRLLIIRCAGRSGTPRPTARSAGTWPGSSTRRRGGEVGEAGVHAGPGGGADRRRTVASGAGIARRAEGSPRPASRWWLTSCPGVIAWRQDGLYLNRPARIRPLITARLAAIADSMTGRQRPENRSLPGPSVRHHGQAGCSEWEQMTTPEQSRGSPARKRAVLLALRYYGRQMARLRRFTVPAMLLPALGNTCIFYIAPLIVAQLVGRLAGHGAGRDRRGDAVCARLRRRAAFRRGRVADRHSLPEPPRRPRNREPVRDRHGRAAGEGRGVLPRQLRRLADQAGAELRFPVRGLHRQPGVQHRRQSRAAGVRVGGAVALRPVARRRAHRRDRDHRCRYRTADPPSSEARRPARGSDRARVRACRRQPDEHGHDPRVRGRGPGGRRAPQARRRPATQVDAVLGLREPAHRRAGRADVRADQRARPAARGRARRGPARHRGDHRRLHLLLQRDEDHVRVQPDLPPAGELADRGRAVHRVAVYPAGRGRPGCARAAAAEGQRRPLRARDVSRTRAGGRCSPASTSPCRAGPSSAWSAGQAAARPR